MYAADLTDEALLQVRNIVVKVCEPQKRSEAGTANPPVFSASRRLLLSTRDFGTSIHCVVTQRDGQASRYHTSNFIARRQAQDMFVKILYGVYDSYDIPTEKSAQVSCHYLSSWCSHPGPNRSAA